MSYAVEGRIKIVQFWLMRAVGRPVGELMDDVKAVKWLPLKDAIATLSRPHEKVFLSHVGPMALKAARRAARGKSRRPAHDLEKLGRNAFVKAVGSLIGRVAQAAARRAG